ncbi:phosphatidate cytidyltransferase [Ketogulonicigenium robustum]|uniref:Phosphatidate cytidyltransferase n=1 Tax=Ketogulonicigenium robustum TaxID=92947 RepID=A0A1W6NZ28_9RHOB|nr:UDP-2,3-diacylglucosamine diphosphatase LpxI [Ketogulonicigenium robustum]ARO14350.1 phosphatidate cytidyltransferase [Ketogulonicigenium robustum]
MIALIGGTGALPPALGAALHDAGQPFMLCEVAGFPFAGMADLPRHTFRIEQIGTLLQDLRVAGVTTVCFAGAIQRPVFDRSAIDAPSAPILAKLIPQVMQGDDALLRAVVAVFEDAGFQVRGAHEVAPALLPAAGVLGAAQTAPDARDITRARQVHDAMAAADLGQGLVVRRGQVLAVEAGLGTDFMLTSLAGLADGGVFYKAPKAGQDLRVDMPVIGPTTVAEAAAAGITAIAIAAGGVLVLDHAATVAAAEAAGLSIWVM